MPTEVLATRRADQQIAALDRRQTTQFNTFVDDLAARGCAALAYRLSGPTPIDHVCVKHLRDELRVVVGFESTNRAWILLVGPHNEQDQEFNIYTELYGLLGVQPPDAGDARNPHAATTSNKCLRPSAPNSTTSSPAPNRCAGQDVEADVDLRQEREVLHRQQPALHHEPCSGGPITSAHHHETGRRAGRDRSVSYFEGSLTKTTIGVRVRRLSRGLTRPCCRLRRR